MNKGEQQEDDAHWSQQNTCAHDVLYDKRRYALFNAETGEQTLLPTIGRDASPAMAALQNSEILLSLGGQSQVFGEQRSAAVQYLQAQRLLPYCT